MSGSAFSPVLRLLEVLFRQSATMQSAPQLLPQVPIMDGFTAVAAVLSSATGDEFSENLRVYP